MKKRKKMTKKRIIAMLKSVGVHSRIEAWNKLGKDAEKDFLVSTRRTHGCGVMIAYRFNNLTHTTDDDGNEIPSVKDRYVIVGKGSTNNIKDAVGKAELDVIARAILCTVNASGPYWFDEMFEIIPELAVEMLERFSLKTVIEDDN